MREPKVAVLILNWNRAKDTEECLNSIFQQSYSNYKIVLVDNGSTEKESLEIGKKYKNIVFIRSEENLGFAGGNNLGIRYALGEGYDYIFILNNDVILDRDCLLNLIKVGEYFNSAGIIGPAVYSYYEKNKIISTGGKIDWWRGKPLDKMEKIGFSLKPKVVEHLNGCGLLVKKEVFEKIGLLDEEYFLFYEETDFCVRARRKGYKVVFVPEAKLWHKISQSTGGTYTPMALYFGTRNRLLFMWKNGDFFSWIPFFLFIFPGSVFKNLWKFRNKKKEKKWFILGIIDFFRKRFGKGRWSEDSN
ncbi:MAG: glycosyltransferase family 2 protein [Caldiserica bacterium]|nr:MAG: glycosyltransferase family 2 protein [Caldisericota bacterium]